MRNLRAAAIDQIDQTLSAVNRMFDAVDGD
jgi:hypothetical protein